MAWISTGVLCYKALHVTLRSASCSSIVAITGATLGFESRIEPFPIRESVNCALHTVEKDGAI